MSDTRKLTTKEVSTLLGIPEGTLKAWRARGQGPPFEQPGGAGTTPLYDLRALELFRAVRR